MSRFLSLFLLVLISCQSADQNRIEINVWYGERQEFGKIGLPQRWINIVGDVQAADGVRQLTYRLNDEPALPLTVGPDSHRLAARGDFNIDLDINLMEPGENLLVIEALDSAGKTASKLVMVILHPPPPWPLPYSIDWSTTQNIQHVAQIVDGHWEITDQGLHNVDVYYDRVVAFGDASWENYEVRTTVTFHSFTPPSPGPPTYNVSHAAIASRWPGHDTDGLQPNRKWFPLGATSEFRLTVDFDSCRWRIFDGPKETGLRFYVEQTPEQYREILLNKPYGMKHRVETIGENTTRYSAKLWPLDQEEPAEWDLVGVERDENLAGGGALLIAHHTEVTFGNVDVVPVEPEIQ